MWRGALGLVLCLLAVPAPADTGLQARQERALKDRAALREQIGALQKRIEAAESSRRDATAALQASEQAISDISRRLAELDARHAALQESLDKLDDARAQQAAERANQQQALVRQLRAQYASGLSPWTALLSGRDPQVIGRELAYLAYVSRARTQALDALRGTLERLAQLRQQTDASQADLTQLLAETQAQKQALQDQQAVRQQVLREIQARLSDERSRAQDLQARDERMRRLISALEAEIAKAEARRQAELKAQAARRAREKAEQARRAREAREAAAAGAGEPGGAGQVAAAPDDERARAGASGEGAPAAAQAEPEGGFPGLHKGLPQPVSGQALGRFGAQRPDGGLWRGIVLRAPAGTPVRVVAAGRVVYAHWLSGFGNLMIVDHGRQYLSIYGYNQALLRQVGDIVARGDVVARVGATGGQVEPGLYFELRHEGAPINPQLWLQP